MGHQRFGNDFANRHARVQAGQRILKNDLQVPAQAVGQGCGGNPIPILIPCHRVLGSSGLGGFSGRGGVETKVWLLRHEGAAGLLI